MILAETILDLRQAVRVVRAAGETIGLVPTMGALHAGHTSLIDAAAGECDFVVVTIFVNPIQFAPTEDFADYPRAPVADLALCEQHGAAAIFAPGVEEMFPRQNETSVSVAHLSEKLCGRSRPGHFTGVCTVVAKLFNLVQPDRAYFGAKDYQQAVILRRMAEDLNFPVEVVTCPIVREPDGLAISSRNAYLTQEQRLQAPALYAALRHAQAWVRRETPAAAEVIQAIRADLAEHAPLGEVDYVQLVDPETLEDVETTDRPVVTALAVRFGKARLIDNLRIEP